MARKLRHLMVLISDVESLVDEQASGFRSNVSHMVWDSMSSDGSERFVQIQLGSRSRPDAFAEEPPKHVFWDRSGVPVPIDSIAGHLGLAATRMRDSARSWRIKDAVGHWTSGTISARLQPAGDALTSGGEADVDIGACDGEEDDPDTSSGEESPTASPSAGAQVPCTAWRSSEWTVPSKQHGALQARRGRRRRMKSGEAAGHHRATLLHTVWDLGGSSEGDSCACETVAEMPEA
ncbi:unnamed protein product [Symbiodinium pilosum]|uniref:Uncharacterized protein n=1 Tax=Symbiodinium pilosum TaxID=2952 RepID=A0A812XXX9_SYMPI|nr:unnamed protein product [Symbiodinium pilosum]